MIHASNASRGKRKHGISQRHTISLFGDRTTSPDGNLDEVVVVLTTIQDLMVNDCECPITMESFDKADVEFLPGARMIPEIPELCVGILPCGHCFGVVPLTYHMLRTGMQCPCCRLYTEKMPYCSHHIFLSNNVFSVFFGACSAGTIQIDD